MPIYEYQCEECGTRTEVLQRVGAPPIGACESCGGEMKRMVSAPAFQFKGTGWYVTDYARKGSSGNGESSAKTKAKTDGEKSATKSSSDSGDSSAPKPSKDTAKSRSAKESSGSGS